LQCITGITLFFMHDNVLLVLFLLLSPKPLSRMVGDEVALATANPKPCIILSHYTAFQCMVI